MHFPDQMRAQARLERGTEKESLNIPIILAKIRKAIQGFPKAAMFDLAERGYSSLFQQVIGCLLSIRTYDEVSLQASLKLFE